MGAVIVGVGVGGSVAAAVSALRNDNTNNEFTSLHPEKSQINSHSEEPHVLIGSVPIAGGLTARVYVTTKPGIDDCVLVEHFSKSGQDQDGLGACGQNSATSAEVRIIYDAAVGWVPLAGATDVVVTFDNHRAVVPVVQHHFAQATTESAEHGSTETVTARNALGQTVGSWTVQVE